MIGDLRMTSTDEQEYFWNLWGLDQAVDMYVRSLLDRNSSLRAVHAVQRERNVHGPARISGPGPERDRRERQRSLADAHWSDHMSGLPGNRSTTGETETTETETNRMER